MTEPIEKWRNEFESYSDEKFISKFPSGTYQWQFMDDRWNGFTMAKRSQPVVELPNASQIFFDTKLQEKGFVSAIEYVCEILEESGINYRIKGE